MRLVILALPLAVLPAGYLLVANPTSTSMQLTAVTKANDPPANEPNWTPQPGRSHEWTASSDCSTAPRTTTVDRMATAQTDALADGLFTRLDADDSGRVELAEAPSFLANAFARWDVNGDGVIDRTEFQRYFRQRSAEIRTSRGSVDAASMNSSAVALPMWFTVLDTDRTGRITEKQWRAAGRSMEEFQALDRDGDGIVTRQEALAGQAIALSSASPGSVVSSSQPTASAPAVSGSASRSTHPSVTASTGKTPDQLEAHYLTLSVGGRTTLASQPQKNGAAPSTQAKTQPPARSVSHAAPKPPARAVALALPLPAPPTPPPPPAVIPDREYATLPLPLTNQSDYWTLRNDQNVAFLQEGGKANVLFLGDSITDLLATGAGQTDWQRYFLPLGSADFAVGGARTSQVLWQIETGQVAAASPKVVVLLIGTNNLGLGQSPAEVAAGITTIVYELQKQLPKTRILLLGILPRGLSLLDPFRAPIAEVNSLIADLDDGNWVKYVDIGGAFLSPDGSLSPLVMSDGVHPTAFGYDIYTVGIWGSLVKLLTADGH